MKKFCKDLREHATKIINYEKKNMIPLTKEEKYIIMIKKFVIYARKYLILVIKNCHYTGKYRGAAHNICNLRFL